MSFAGEVKQELLEHQKDSAHCRMAELAGVLLYYGRTERRNGTLYLILALENENLAKKCFTFLKKSFNMEFVASYVELGERKQGEYRIELAGEHKVSEVLGKLGFVVPLQGGDLHWWTGRIIRKPCCIRAWIRALFLCAGTMNDPEKSYHFEITVPTEVIAEKLMGWMQEFQCEPKRVSRRQSISVYLKDGTQIADMLKVMEAHVALMNYENARVVRETRGQINRRVNCEVSNLNKTVAAAQKQIEDIRMLQEQTGYGDLPEELRSIAELRVRYPEASLKELGELMHPPLGRSGVNHRLQKLCSIAEGLRSK